MYLFGINICIYFIKKKPLSVFKKFQTLLLIVDLKLSSITVAKLYLGAYNSQFIEKNLNIVDNF